MLSTPKLSSIQKQFSILRVKSDLVRNQDLAAEFQPSMTFYDQIIDPRKKERKNTKKKIQSEVYNGNHDRAMIVVAGTASL